MADKAKVLADTEEETVEAAVPEIPAGERPAGHYKLARRYYDGSVTHPVGKEVFFPADMAPKTAKFSRA